MVDADIKWFLSLNDPRRSGTSEKGGMSILENPFHFSLED